VPDGPVRDHVLADDPGAVAECHPAAGFPNYGEPSEASAAPPGALLQGDGGEEEDLGLAGCGLDVATA
jgi:hypothetical protein